MNGFSTRRQLHRALHAEVTGDVPRLTDLPPAPSFNAGAHGLGTPLHGERLRAEKRERLYGRIFKVAIWAMLLASMFIVGRHSVAQRQAIEGTNLYYRMKAERLDPRQRLCQIDPHEGCLVCMHRDVAGSAVVSTHC